jgi:hypothetical protein
MYTVPVARLTAPAVVGRRLSEGLGRNAGFTAKSSCPCWQPINVSRSAQATVGVLVLKPPPRRRWTKQNRLVLGGPTN